jgi:uncharacterized protein
MPEPFLDSSYLVALHEARDQNHDKARRHWATLRSTPRIVTTSYVVDEIATYFNSRGHHTRAVQIGNDILQSSVIRLVHVEEELFHEAWGYFTRHQDKTYSFTDCISFVLMGRLGLRSALSFDQHFSQAGFERLPQI